MLDVFFVALVLGDFFRMLQGFLFNSPFQKHCFFFCL